MTEINIGDRVAFVGRDLVRIGTLVHLPKDGVSQVQIEFNNNHQILEVPEELLSPYQYNINDLRDEAFQSIASLWLRLEEKGHCRCTFCNVVASDKIPFPHKDNCIVLKIKRARLG